MGYSSKIYVQAKNRISQRRMDAERAADNRKRKIFEKLPRAKELEKQISSCGILAARAVINGGNVAEEIEKLRVSNLTMQKELRELLLSNGYPEDVLEPRYTCKKCGDTGSYEAGGKTIMCDCFRQMLVTCSCEELNRSAPLSLSTFDSFSLDYYDKAIDSKYGVSPYEHMSKILKYCKNYAESFDSHSESILMKGATGLGKTHLSLAIANEVIRKGHGVIYASAPSFMQRIEKQYFSKEEDGDDLLNMILECDLLIIDDLGTEFHGNFSVSQMYNIFNSRMLANKPMIINTNLTMYDLEKIYTERFVSRISGNAKKLDFIGKDIRVRRK